MGKEVNRLERVTASGSSASCKAAAIPLGKPFWGQPHRSHGHLATAKIRDLHNHPYAHCRHKLHV